MSTIYGYTHWEDIGPSLDTYDVCHMWIREGESVKVVIFLNVISYEILHITILQYCSYAAR